MSGPADLARQLAGALQRGELDVWYQPEVEVDGRHVVAVEALLRWHHPSGELYEAGRFVRIAEETGLIVAIGAWALLHACEQGVVWRTLLERPPPVLRVNLSEAEVAGSDLLATLDVALATGIDPAALSLELDESALLLAGVTGPVGDNLRGINQRGLAWSSTASASATAASAPSPGCRCRCSSSIAGSRPASPTTTSPAGWSRAWWLPRVTPGSR